MKRRNKLSNRQIQTQLNTAKPKKVHQITPDDVYDYIDNEENMIRCVEMMKDSPISFSIQDLVMALNFNSIEVDFDTLFEWMIAEGYLDREDRFSPTELAKTGIFVFEKTSVYGAMSYTSHSVRITLAGMVYFLNRIFDLEFFNNSCNESK